MVVIRLSRRGSRHNPKYRVTVADSRRSARGRFIESIGHYDPQIKTPVINAEKYQSWIAKGAQASQTVRDLYRRMQNPPDKPKTKGGGAPRNKPASGGPATGRASSGKASADAGVKTGGGGKPDAKQAGGNKPDRPPSGKASAGAAKNKGEAKAAGGQNPAKQAPAHTKPAAGPADKKAGKSEKA